MKFDGIVNGQRHMDEVQRGKRDTLPNKMPSKYRISLHIDDEEIVAVQGRTYGFNVYRLDAQDDDWEAKVIAEVKRIEKMEHHE